MEMLMNIILTDIEKPFVVHAFPGRTGKITERSSYGLSFSQGGQITYTMHEKQYVSKPGTAILLPKGGNYTSCCDRGGLFPVVNFQCDGLDCRQITLIPLAEESACIRLFEDMKCLSLAPENRLELFAVFYKLLSLLHSGATPRPLHFLNVHIEKNLSDPMLSNTLLAEKMGISEVYLRKLFLAYYKTTPKQYILDMRLRKAKQMLMDTYLTVTEISQACGFSSLHHFCRCFKDKIGMTPTEYAQHHRIHQI